MIRFSTTRRDDRFGRGRASRPILEGLERRELLFATHGGLWAHPNLVTYSFVPDGTNVGGVPSTLFQTLNASYPTAAWQLQFQKAAAVWEAVANIDLAQVGDNGEAVGAYGNQQGDPNVGDIRIGATAQQAGQLAFAFLPPPYNGGTDAGDLFLNSSQYWGPGGYDVETVAIHEIGHALGMGHSQINTAVMYAYYNGTKQNLTADDVAGLQSVYGAVPADTAGNGTFATATDVTSQLNGQLQAVVAPAALVANNDLDYFKVTVPAGTTGTMTVTIQSSNLSSLSPRVTIFNANNQGLAQASAPNSYGGTATVTLGGVQPGQVYDIRAGGASGGPTGIGAYGLEVNFGSNSMPPVAPPNTVVPWQPDQNGGTSSLTAGPGSHHHSARSHNLGHDQPATIHVGTLSGRGDFLMVGARAFRGHRPRS